MASPNIRGTKHQAWVTCALQNYQVAGALVLAISLRRVVTRTSLGVTVSPNVSPNLRLALARVFDLVHLLDTEMNCGLKDNDFSMIFTLTLGSFEKCVFLAPNMLVLRNSDEIFDKGQPETQPIMWVEGMDFSVVMVKPFLAYFRLLIRYLSKMELEETGFEAAVQSWMKNQGKKGIIFLDEKYNRRVSLEGNCGGSLLDEMDISIVKLELKPNLVKAESNKLLGMVEMAAVKYWNELYEQEVKPIVESPIEVLDASWRAESLVKEPIAIVGMSCRHPGSNNLEEFWKLLVNGEDGTGCPPEWKWKKGQSTRNPADDRKTNAGFLKTPVDEFDAKFFGISPKEALFMDPQHRLLHEVIREGLEDAAIDPLGLRGSNMGVFMGSWTNEYRETLRDAGESDSYRRYMGNSIGAATARISFLLGVTGSSVATESGCSAAMVAVQMGCKSLQLGETSLALACGVNLLLTPFGKDEIPMVPCTKRGRDRLGLKPR